MKTGERQISSLQNNEESMWGNEGVLMEDIDLDRMQALFSIIESLGGEMCSEQLLQTIVDGAAEGANANGAWVWSLHKDNTWSAVAKTESVNHNEDFNRPLALLGPGSDKLLDGGIIIIDDYAAWAYKHKEEFEKIPNLPDKYFDSFMHAKSTVAAVPLRELGRVNGLLAVFRWDPPVPYTSADIQLLLMYASIVSMVLLRAKAYEALAQTKERLEVQVEARTKDLARTTQLLRQALNSNMQIQELERKRIASDLHDRSCQLIAASLFDLQIAQAGLEKGDVSKALQGIASAKDLIRGVDCENRRLIEDLRPAVLSQKGLSIALKRKVDELKERYGGQWEYSTRGDAIALRDNEELVAFQIANEALMNAAKHAQAKQVSVKTTFENGTLTIEVIDDGRGFDAGGVFKSELHGNSEHFGLLMMKERCESLGGKLEVESSAQEGTTVHFSFRAV